MSKMTDQEKLKCQIMALDLITDPNYNPLDNPEGLVLWRNGNVNIDQKAIDYLSKRKKELQEADKILAESFINVDELIEEIEELDEEEHSYNPMYDNETEHETEHELCQNELL